jgi:DUF4097 and DUF4098 domain-containing protein YvlB
MRVMPGIEISFGRISLSNGSVEVTLLGEPSVKLDATTSNGEIICKLPIVEMETEVKRLVGVVGGGDAVLCQSQRQERRQTENPHRQITEYCPGSL